jgi:hypothetical protein
MTGGERPQPLPPNEVIAAVHRILEEGSIIPTGHIRQRMRQRHFDIQDVMHVLEHGSINRAPEWNETYHEWNYDVEGADIEGEPLTIRVAIAEDTLTLITGF